MRSKIEFNRWQHIQRHTWPFQLYKQYNEELSNFIWAEYASHKYVYKHLGKEVVDTGEDSKNFFSFPPHVWNFITVKDWSKAFNEGQNFLYLNCVMALNSNFETFLSAIISLAIESNPGVLLNASKTIDGTVLLKRQLLNKQIYEEKLNACLKGTWSKRKSEIKSLFGNYPEEIDRHESTLEAIRKLRNRIGHAFGRDIEKTRDFSSLQKLPLERVSLQKLKKWLNVTFEVASALDSFLLDDSIGEYQAILAYHNNKQKWTNKVFGERARELKTMYGAIDQQVGIIFCKGLIEYYDKA